MRIDTGMTGAAKSPALAKPTAKSIQIPELFSCADRANQPEQTASCNKDDILKAYKAASRGYEGLLNHLSAASQVPYGKLAKNGIIEYNGVVFTCDERSNSICLGDMSNSKDVLSIPLSNGGQLKVNRDNIDQLAKAISMFSPEDINRILRALAEDAKVSSKQKEIDDLKASVGEQITSNAIP